MFPADWRWVLWLNPMTAWVGEAPSRAVARRVADVVGLDGLCGVAGTGRSFARTGAAPQPRSLIDWL